MKTHLEQLLAQAFVRLQQDGAVPAGPAPAIQVQRTREERYGDFSSNLALVLAKTAKRNPRELAELIAARLPSSPHVRQVEVAGSGFINFRLTEGGFRQIVRDVLEAGASYGSSKLGLDQRVCVEFVSANPTGPLHVGHGRGAAYGAAVASVLETAGFNVHREYYVNDAGRQMDILATSVWLRYLELCGEKLRFPSNGYRGDYVWDIAAALHRARGDALRFAADMVFTGLPEDARTLEEIDAGAPGPNGDKEAHIDGLVSRAQHLLGEHVYREVFDLGLNTILADIRNDLEDFGIRYDNWYSERSLTELGKVEQAIHRLKAAGWLYEHDGAWWFRSTAFGDEKDRVVVRENGQTTYFASDIAYHMDKLARGFKRVIDVWGADHHGYVPRVKAALAAMGDDPALLDVLLVQFAILYRNGQKVQMSTRSGEFVTLRELRKEVGNDAARFFYVMRKSDQHLDFDLDLAKSHSADNPVYYVQYAHARIVSVMGQLRDRGLAWDRVNGLAHLNRLVEAHEQALLKSLARYPEVIEAAARSYEPHQVAHYLRELANDFHTYYNAHTFLVEDDALRDARLSLILAVRQVLGNGLGLLGVSAPERM